METFINDRTQAPIKHHLALPRAIVKSVRVFCGTILLLAYTLQENLILLGVVGTALIITSFAAL